MASAPSASEHGEDLQPKVVHGPGALMNMVPVAITGTEQLSRPYRFVVELADDHDSAPAWDDIGSQWLGLDVTIDLLGLDTVDAESNYISGVIAAVEVLGAGTGAEAAAPTAEPTIYRIEIVPKLWLLSLNRGTRVYRNMSVMDVVKSVTGAVGVDLTVRGSDSKNPHPSTLIHITQYDETDLDFVSRLLEQEGASYWFEHGNRGNTTMVVANDPANYPSEGDAIDISGSDTSLHAPRGVGLRVALVPSETKVSAYDFNNPTQRMEGSKSIAASKAPVRKGSWSVTEGIWAKNTAVVDAAAAIEADRQVNRAFTFSGFSKDSRFRAGSRVKLSQERHCLLLRVSHAWTHGHGTYSNTYEWMAWSALPWRPPRETPRPAVQAPVPGVITATAGNQGVDDEGALDGSYMVRLPDGNAEPRVARLAQPYAGHQRGLHCPLPPDTEVLLTHLSGNPDMPVIAAAMPNINDPGPVLDANKTQCVLRTGAGHVLVFEDKDGEEKVTLTSKSGQQLLLNDKGGEEKTVLASKSKHQLVLDDKSGEEKASLTSKSGHSLVFEDKDGAEKATLAGKGGNTLIFDEKSGSEKITLKATKDHEVTVAGESKTTVTKAAALDCQDELTLSASKKITLKVGSATIVIDSSGKISLSGTGIELASDADASISAKAKVAISAQADVAVSGLNASIEAKIGATVKGNATAELSASGQTTVKGGMVMIN